ncbi:MAG: hypothetical protein GY861_12180, partial [bacterium]|nr:hypothetical protein [bacterium]
EVFTGGEAGGGKSFLLLLDAMRYLKEPGYKAVIFRRTYPDLEDLINEARQIYVPCGAKYNAAKHNFVWENNSIIMFRHMQHVKDIYSHQGKQYDYIGFDELPHFPKIAYTYLFSRLRGKNPNIKRYIRSTGNPDGEHVLWVKHRFVDQLKPGEIAYFKTINDKDVKVAKETRGAISRKFIPCIRDENRVLMENDPDYENMLDQLPEAKKRALKDGKWDVQDKPDQIVETKWWEKALLGGNEYVDDGNYTVACDFGHRGKDLSVEFLGRGNRPYRCRSWNMTKTTQMADILAMTCGSVAKTRVMLGVDCIGPGAGVGDDIETHHAWLAAKMERCVEKDDLYKPLYKGQMVFNNLRSQMWWKFREDMQEGTIDLSAFMKKDAPGDGVKVEEMTSSQKEDGYFEDLFTLQEEILAHTYRVHNGKLIVIPKEDLRKPENLGRSPDFADALVIWNWVRRHHYDYSAAEDEEYEADTYMKQYMKDLESAEDDDAIYEDEWGNYDEAVYED